VNPPDRQHPLRLLLGVALAYLVVGLSTAYLARSASSIALRTVWRLAAWAVSLVLFVGQLLYERFRWRSSVRRAALHAALAVALGAFGLAAAGPVRSHWGAPDRWRAALLSLVLWPIVTGVPAFCVALVAGRVMRPQPASAEPSPQHRVA
jgi:hypothetical protein